MGIEQFAEQESARLGGRLTGLYARTFLAYLLAMIGLWAVGIEAIFYHPTPFYAEYEPVFPGLPSVAIVILLLWGTYLLLSALFSTYRSDGEPPQPWVFAAFGGVAAVTGVILVVQGIRAEAGILAYASRVWEALGWHLIPIFLFAGFLGLFLTFVPHLNWFGQAPDDPRTTRRFLAGLILVCFLFSGAIAMIRGGPDGISQAYERRDSEFVGDIGTGGSIRGLFSEYERFHGVLSMHSKVHPPGPIALLWILSYLVGQSAMGLSLATMAFGSLAIIPLYFWGRDLMGHGAALTACLLYAFVPTIVLFTATSANILFMPFTIGTLFLFWRALHRASGWYAVAAGAGYGIMSLLSFNLIAVGAFFGIVGLWRLAQPRMRWAVIQTAAVMLAVFLGFHTLVWLWSGFDMIETFHMAKAQFDMDQHQLDQLSPRYPQWAWVFLNPAAWFYFAGIPVSVLFIWRLFNLPSSKGARGMSPDSDCRGLVVACFLTLIALNFLYLGRGEGERSAMHIIPFLVIPAAYALHQMGSRTRSFAALLATLAFLAFQCWFTESYFYTYW